jgi:hypothetical protein
MTSPDAFHWTLRSAAADHGWSAVCWSPQRHLFVAVAATGSSSGNRVMTSSDGCHWSSRSSTADHRWSGICWCAERGVVLAVASAAPAASAATSAPGNRLVMLSPAPQMPLP